jgi:hypothetical protein
VIRFGNNGRKINWIVKRYGKYGKSQLNSEMIWKIWKKGKLNNWEDMEKWKKRQLKSKKIQKIWKKVS